MAEPSFSKDFGYLWPFFDRLAAHATETDQVDLSAAISSAREACERVDVLLQGKEPAPTEASPRVDAAAAVAPPEAPQATKTEVVRERWTVGSMYVRDPSKS